jgi:hypothetical protein
MVLLVASAAKSLGYPDKIQYAGYSLGQVQNAVSSPGAARSSAATDCVKTPKNQKNKKTISTSCAIRGQLWE